MSDEKRKMLDGELYDAMDSTLVAERERARSLLRELNDPSDPDSVDHPRSLLPDLFGSTGENVYVEPPFHCDYGYNVHVGDDFYANVDCVFLDVCEISFGDGCLVGPGVHVYAATHPLDPDDRAMGKEFGVPITVGDDVWIGGRAVLTPGVTVGDGAVIAAGAVVTDDVQRNTVVGGNPARVLRRLDDE